MSDAKAERYLQQAGYCLRMANSAREDRFAEDWFRMSNMWREMAERSLILAADDYETAEIDETGDQAPKLPH
jgi:hypothetical protein